MKSLYQQAEEELSKMLRKKLNLNRDLSILSKQIAEKTKEINDMNLTEDSKSLDENT